MSISMDEMVVIGFVVGTGFTAGSFFFEFIAYIVLVLFFDVDIDDDDEEY